MKLTRLLLSLFLSLFLTLSTTLAFPQNNKSNNGDTWSFAVSGDSRNCGDITMPAIANGVLANHAAFYWHLGDFRALYDFDEDLAAARKVSGKKINITEYLALAWPDFIENQLTAFGDTPVYLAIGNHELYSGHTRGDYIAQFADWINRPDIAAQRLKDDPADHKVKTYYHWQHTGVDFLSLDNADWDMFDNNQMKWAEAVLKHDAADPQIKTVVVGMHAALPDSIASGHSMNDWPLGTASGRQLYEDLLSLKSNGKRVYIVASHSHFFMAGIFHTAPMQQKNAELPGWIVGNAGAHRYKLPDDASEANQALTNVYGYLLATVSPSGDIDFKFQQLKESDIPQAVRAKYGEEQVNWCWNENSDAPKSKQ